MLRWLFRHYRARARLAARQARNDRLRKELAAQWRVVKRWEDQWYYLTDGKSDTSKPAGVTVVVAETNMLGQRRWRYLETGPLFRGRSIWETKSPKAYAEVLSWVNFADEVTTDE